MTSSLAVNQVLVGLHYLQSNGTTVRMQRKRLRVVTFNINDVNKRLPNLLAWLHATKAHVVCLQELKATDVAFPVQAIEDAGYDAVWQGERTWNGVAILSRVGAPIVTRRSLPRDMSDRQSRYIEAAVQGIVVGCIYLPNGNPQPGPKFDYKMAWFERLLAHAADLLEANVPVVLAGDYNVAPTDQDIYQTKSYAKNALVQPAPRAAFRRLLDQGWTDAIRARHPDDVIYTFWDYRRDRWQRNAGLRLDHLLLSPALAERLTDAGVDRNLREDVNASDHAPTWIDLNLPNRKNA